MGELKKNFHFESETPEQSIMGALDMAASPNPDIARDGRLFKVLAPAFQEWGAEEKSRGTKPVDAIISWTTVVASLSTGFLFMVEDPEHRRRLAQVIAEGIGKRLASLCEEIISREADQ